MIVSKALQNPRCIAGMVKLARLSKTYARGEAGVAALHEVTLEVGRGEFCAFVGPSGCGKSTLLNLVGGLDQPSSGELFLDGRATTAFTSHDWTVVRREVLGIVFQAFHLVPGLTALENVALPLMLRGERGGAVTRRAEEVLESVQMARRRHHRPGELSGGEQQRVAIARALAHRPKVLLADEPTGNLDSHQGAEIMTLIRSLAKAGGVTVLLVTHSQTAAQCADYIWSMQDGRLVSRTLTSALTGVA
jgi:ABC-type lipoprotein export system ATPase subunit